MAQQQQTLPTQSAPPPAAMNEEDPSPILDSTQAAEALAAFGTSSPAPTLEAVIAETERAELAKMEIETRQFQHNQRLAKMFLASGCFQDAKAPDTNQSIAKAMVKIELGRSMGFSPIESMQGIDIIKGRPAIGAHLRAARMQSAGYHWNFVRNDDVACELDVYYGYPSRGGVLLGKVGFTFEEAKRARLTDKDNWKMYASDMLFARAITRAQRRFAPGALKGLTVLDVDEAESIPYELSETAPAMQMPERESRTA